MPTIQRALLPSHPAVAMGELNRCSAKVSFLFFPLLIRYGGVLLAGSFPRLPMNHWSNCAVRRPTRLYRCFKWDIMEGVSVVRVAFLFSFSFFFFNFLKPLAVMTRLSNGSAGSRTWQLVHLLLESGDDGPARASRSASIGVLLST